MMKKNNLPTNKNLLFDAAWEIRTFLNSCSEEEIRESFGGMYNTMNLCFAKAGRGDLCGEPFQLEEE